jgi:hypothetical protein
MTAFWDVRPRSLVEVCRRFRSTYCLHHQGDLPDDVAERTLTRRSTTMTLHEPHRRRLLSSYSPPCEPEFSQVTHCFLRTPTVFVAARRPAILTEVSQGFSPSLQSNAVVVN